MNILEEANRLVHGDRGADYGHPYVDYECTAELWRSLIKRRYGVDLQLTPDFACLLMSMVKASREAGKHKTDNLVDMAGYAECAQMCLEHAAAKEVK
jgi:hypothetical protein